MGSFESENIARGMGVYASFLRQKLRNALLGLNSEMLGAQDCERINNFSAEAVKCAVAFRDCMKPSTCKIIAKAIDDIEREEKERI